MFKGIWVMTELFWDLWKAWPRCLKVYKGWPSCSETYWRLGRRVWRDRMGDRAVLGLMEGLTDVFEGVGWEAELFWDLWKVWPTCLKGLDGKPTCSRTYWRLDRRASRNIRDDWAFVGLIEGLVKVFEGIWGMRELFRDISKTWPRCLKAYERLSSCFRIYKRPSPSIWKYHLYLFVWINYEFLPTYIKLIIII